MTETTDIKDLIIEGIRERKGRRITHVDLSAIESAPVNNFIICEGTSSMHAASIADSIRDYLLEKGGIKPYNYDGYRASQWIVIDYGDTMVHVFAPEIRSHYNLEELWSDAVSQEIPDML